MPARYLLLFLFIVVAFGLSASLPNATCAASHECEAKGSILTVTPVFSSVISPLDEAMVGNALRFMDTPSMQPAKFPVFTPSTDETNPPASLLSTESVEGFLSTDSQGEIGMF